MNLIVKHRGKSRNLTVRRVGLLGKGFGLMFKSKNTESLFFDFKRDKNLSITSFFVFFSFLVIWLDSENRVLDLRVVKPFRTYITSNKKFRRLVEIPFSSKNAEDIRFFVGKIRKV